MGIEEKTDVLIIGAGSSGIMAADVVLSRISGIEVKVIEKEVAIGGMPNHCPKVSPNSPVPEFLHFLNRAEDRIPNSHVDEYSDLFQKAHSQPKFARLAEATRFIYKSVLSPDPRFSIDLGKKVIGIVDKGDRYLTVTDNGEYESRSVICSQGAVPMEFPYYFEGETLDTYEALNGSADFEGKKIVIAGAAHTAAILLVNALEGGAEFVRVTYRDKAFTEFSYSESDDKRINRFTGIREPALGRLNQAMEKYDGRYELVKATSPATAGVGSEWSAVSAVGFRSNEVLFIGMDDTEAIVRNVNQGRHPSDLPPNLLLNGEPIRGVYGLGIAYPQIYTQGYLPNTVDSHGAKIVGTNLTYDLSLKVSEDIRRLRE